MDSKHRNLIDQLSSELAAVMKNAGTEATTLPSMPLDRRAAAVEELARATAKAQAITAVMLSLICET